MSSLQGFLISGSDAKKGGLPHNYDIKTLPRCYQANNSLLQRGNVCV